MFRKSSGGSQASKLQIFSRELARRFLTFHKAVDYVNLYIQVVLIVFYRKGQVECPNKCAM